MAFVIPFCSVLALAAFLASASAFFNMSSVVIIMEGGSGVNKRTLSLCTLTCATEAVAQVLFLDHYQITFLPLSKDVGLRLFLDILFSKRKSDF